MDDLLELKLEGSRLNAVNGGGAGVGKRDKREELLLKLRKTEDRASKAEHELKQVLQALNRMR